MTDNREDQNPPDYMDTLEQVTIEDCASLREKERTYRGSWKKRGGVGAFMMLARKWDRLEGMLANPDERAPSYDVFEAIRQDYSGADGTALAEVRDLRRYLLLVEAEMLARGVIQNTRGRSRKTFDSVVAEGVIYEKGKPPCCAGKDGVIIRIGDACTWETRSGAIVDGVLTDVTADGEPVVVKTMTTILPSPEIAQWNKLRKTSPEAKMVGVPK